MAPKTIIKSCFIVLIILAVVSCKDNSSENNTHNNSNQNIEIFKNNLTILTPMEGSVYAIGDSIYFDIETSDKSIPDSIVVYYNSKSIINLTKSPFRITWKAQDVKVGKNSFRIASYQKGKKVDQKFISLIFKSDIVPEKIEYKIIRKLKHNPNNYTQGFVYENGYIYEGTGKRGQSHIEKYEPANIEPIQSISNENSIFGEGIVIVNDKIVQLTYTSNIGFIYDKTTFKRLGSFDFYTEGWGLTYDGNQLIMSDGSNNLYYLDKNTYTKTGQIEVYDNNGPVVMLNELEYIDGKIYANIYGKDVIVIIDTKTGKVLSKIDCSKLRPENLPFDTEYAFNGIAYNPENKHLYVTGKYWPVTYELELIIK
ncbi:MAG: glutaminyl-peptide cyclotransferase [Marinilabiliales bacterium]